MLKGSEKQIKWAEDLKKTMLGYAECNIRNAKLFVEQGCKPNYLNKIYTINAAEAVYYDLKKLLDICESAAKIIDLRTMINQDYLTNLAVDLDRAAGRC